MTKASLTSSTEKERVLIVETHPARELGWLRRTRTTFVPLHRRETGAQVIEAGAGALVNAGPRRSASKAETVDDALARVSASMARAARQSVITLRNERRAASRRTAGRRQAKPSAR